MLLLTYIIIIDDLNAYFSYRKELERMITVLRDVGGEIGLQFYTVEKSNICVIESGKIGDSI